MLEMHKKINRRECLIGWYSFCEKITDNDFNINQIFSGYIEKPLFILIWVDRNINGLVLEAYSIKKQNFQKFQFFQKKKSLLECLNRKISEFNKYLEILENG